MPDIIDTANERAGSWLSNAIEFALEWTRRGGEGAVAGDFDGFHEHAAYEMIQENGIKWAEKNMPSIVQRFREEGHLD